MSPEEKLENSMVVYFVNPPEGSEHSLKYNESEIQQHFYFKNFWNPTTLMLGQKNFQVKINSSFDFVSIWLLDSPRD